MFYSNLIKEKGVLKRYEFK